MDIIEAGHLYGPDRPDFATHFEWLLAKEISQLFSNPHFVFFHDETTARISQQKSSDSWRWQLLIKRTQSDVAKLLLSLGIIEEQMSYIQESDIPNWVHRYIPQKHQKFGYRGDTTKFSCETMDAATYIQKLRKAGKYGVVITILPESYKKQQEKTREILQQSGYDSPKVIIIFHGKKGITVTHWNEQLSEISKKVSTLVAEVSPNLLNTIKTRSLQLAPGVPTKTLQAFIV